MIENRLRAVRGILADRKLDLLLVSSRENVRYLSGFAGSAGWLVIGRSTQTLITDVRYRDQAREESPAFEIEIAETGLHDAVRELFSRWTDQLAIGYEAAHLTVSDYNRLTAPGDADSTSHRLPDIQWVSTLKAVEELMAVKDAGEIQRIAEAARISDRVFEEVMPLVGPGVKERDLAAEIVYRARKHGADRLAFEPIVASGPRSALPHARPSDRSIEAGDMVVFDLGAMVNGYASDMTRTVAVERISDRLSDIYGVVLESQLAALDAVRPGVACAEVDRVARDHIAKSGFGEYFGHGLGHGVGLRVHEDPSLSRRSESELREGMVVTIEPGIYIAGWGGVRIEDLVVVTRDGCEILSATPKELRTAGG